MTVLDLPPLDASGRARRVRDTVADKGLVDAVRPDETSAGSGLGGAGNRPGGGPGQPDGSPPPPGWAMLVRDPSNIRWLTGFSGSNGWVMLAADRLVLVTDGRYAERAEAECAAAGVELDILAGRSAADLRQHVVQSATGCGAVAAEAHHLTHQQWTDLASELPLVAGRRTVEELRRRKDDAEIARIAAAAEIASAALADVAPILADDPAETDVRDELEYRMRRLGAAGPSYDTIVASGPQHAARPHHETSSRRIRHGDTVVIDVGALVDGYHSDMTRTFIAGQPTAEQLERYATVLTAQRAGLDAVAAGRPVREVDAVCRDTFTEAGMGDWFVHGTGHGVGLDIHEAPLLAPSSPEDLTLFTGDVVTIEPGVYHSGFGGIRIEDLVMVTDDGCRILTSFPKEHPCLPSRPTT